MFIFKALALIAALASIPAWGQIGNSSAGVGGFGGPAVLGRGTSGSGARSPELGFRYYAGATYGYDTGLTGFALDQNGNVLSGAAQGVEGVAGVYGIKRSRRTQVSLNYQGGYRQYRNLQGFNGTDQNITLSVSKQLNARQAFGMGVNAGTTNRAFGFGNFGGFVDPNFLGFGLPTAEIFDNRIYYGSGSANFIWQRTARTSFSLVGNGFTTRRTGSVLFGVNGGTAGGDFAYRVSRNQTFSVGYNYLYFNFTRGFGDTHAHGVYAGYALKVARKYDFAIRAGGMRMENLFLQRVQVDPVIAALTGVTATQQVAYRVNYLPTGSVSFNGPLTRRSYFGLSAGLFAIPGNGVLATARNWNGGASYTYTGLRRVGLNGSVNYNEMSNIVGQSQKFRTVGSIFSVAPRLTDNWHWGFSVGSRHFLEGTVNNFQRNSYFVSTGIYYSPGEVPLNIR